MTTVADSLKRVLDSMAACAREAGRDPAAVRLVAVTKTFPVEAALEAWAAGQCVFGENKPQELALKQPLLPQAEWHLIGHLQTNKAKQALQHASLIHSLDSQRLMAELDKRAEALGATAKVLVQLNISDEASKGGLDEAGAEALLAAAAACPRVQILGLMGMAEESSDMALVRRQFARLRRAAERFGPYENAQIQMRELSMGMSGDYRAAIHEGATLVRIGSAIFGGRAYPAAKPA